jgi:hypothetical protein
MKKILMMLGIASMITLISSCTSDPCKDKSAIELCSGKGTLADKNGTCGCNCNDGYTGTKCETELSNIAIGTYSVNEKGSNSGDNTYVVNASKGTSAGEILVKPFYGEFVNNVKVVLKNDGSINITDVQPDNNGNWVTSASGTWTKSNSGKLILKIKYTAEDRSTSTIFKDNIDGTWTQL